MKRRKFVGLSIGIVGAAIPVAVVAKSAAAKSDTVTPEQLRLMKDIAVNSRLYYLSPEERLAEQEEINRRRSTALRASQWSDPEIRILENRNIAPLVINRIK